MIIRILAAILFLAATYPIAQAHMGVECIGVIVALQLIDWPTD